MGLADQAALGGLGTVALGVSYSIKQEPTKGSLLSLSYSKVYFSIHQVSFTTKVILDLVLYRILATL